MTVVLMLITHLVEGNKVRVLIDSNGEAGGSAVFIHYGLGRCGVAGEVTTGIALFFPRRCV